MSSVEASRGSVAAPPVQAGVASAAPGSAESMYLVVADIEAARDELLARGVDVGDVFHEGEPRSRFHESGRVAGAAPEQRTYGSSRLSAIRTATAGCSRRSRRDCLVAERAGEELPR
jgi:hypothetical protein